MHPGYLFLGFSLFVFSCLSNNPYQISENDTFPWLPMKPIIKASTGAETPASFAAFNMRQMILAFQPRVSLGSNYISAVWPHSFT